jgi:hypothetical protein
MPRKEEKKRMSSTSASRLSGRGLQGISVSGQRQLHVLCKREKSKNKMKMEKKPEETRLKAVGEEVKERGGGSGGGQSGA